MYAKKNSLLVEEINQHRETERKLKKSLREKDVLLSEIHHRVKNNMALIYALFELQSNFSKNHTVQDIMDDCKLRLKSLSMIFEAYSGSEETARIDVGGYLSDLILLISRTFHTNHKGVRFHTSVPKLTLSINQAIPFGLICNELLANACKHAFDKKGDNKIEVILEESSGDDEEIRLLISDNGKGLPEGIDVMSSDTLGFTITRCQVAQLKGGLKLCEGKGTQFEIRFKKGVTRGPNSTMLFY
ncbi:MAG: sensor histidine kinase [Balneolaceae bacterium]